MTTATSERTYRVIRFTPDLVRFADYGKLAEMAREVGGAVTITFGQDGSMEARVFWAEA